MTASGNSTNGPSNLLQLAVNLLASRVAISLFSIVNGYFVNLLNCSSNEIESTVVVVRYNDKLV